VSTLASALAGAGAAGAAALLLLPSLVASGTRAAMALFDLPEAIAVVRVQVCDLPPPPLPRPAVHSSADGADVAAAAAAAAASCACPCSDSSHTAGAGAVFGAARDAGGGGGVSPPVARFGWPLLSGPGVSRSSALLFYLGVVLYFFVLAVPAAATVLGLYLTLSVNVVGAHWNEAFSALRIPSYKNFVRLHIRWAPSSPPLSLLCTPPPRMPPCSRARLRTPRRCGGEGSQYFLLI
jgi:hypothetical protein